MRSSPLSPTYSKAPRALALSYTDTPMVGEGEAKGEIARNMQ